MSTKTFKLLIIVLLLSFAYGVEASSRQYDSIFSDANRDYKRGRYADAIVKLESIVRRSDSGQVATVSWDNGRQRPKNWRRAFVLLASMYEEGKGTEKDLGRAWWLYYGAITSPWRTDRETGKRIYVGYTDAPQVPLALCRLSQTFEQVRTYCRPFERIENVKALKDRSASDYAIRKYQEYLETPDPNLLLVRAVIIADSNLVTKAFELGADPNAQVPFSEYESGFSNASITPLWIAANSFGSPYVQKLLAAGADPNFVPEGHPRRSLLEFVWGWGRGEPRKLLALEYIDLLLEHGYVIDVEQLVAIKRAGRGHPEEFDQLLPYVPQPVLQEFEAREAERQQHLARVERERQQKTDREKLERELASAAVRATVLTEKRKIGARLCREEGQNTVIGYVERLTDTKMQIRISESYVTRYPRYQDGNFQQRIIWDYPDNWRLCE